MKHILRISNRFFSACAGVLLMLCCCGGAWAKTVYLKPDCYEWAKGDERYAVYCFGSGDNWYDMTEVAGACGGPIYQATVSDSYTTYIFCRMDGSASGNDWGNRWDQSANMAASDGCYFRVTASSGGHVTSYTFNNNPFAVCVSGTWLRFKGETISLSAEAVGATNFQWYKNGTAISGANSATYTKTNCDISDGGRYTCKAWVVAGQETSKDFDVKVPYLAIQTGGGGDRHDLAFVRANTSAETASCYIHRGVAWNYEMMVMDGVDGRGNTGTMTSDNCTGWTLDQLNNNKWCRIHTTKEGTYYFYLNFSNTDYTPLRLSAVYPSMVQTPGLKVYIENTPAMQARGWSNSSIYYRIGKGKYDKGDDRNWTSMQQMELVPGTARYLYTTTPDWANDFWVWHIANNKGDVNCKSAIYRTYSDDGYPITESSNFEGDEITTDRTIYLNSTSGGYGQDGMNNNCQFYGFTHTDGMITHNFSTGATTHGQIKVEYTHHDNTHPISEAYTARNFNGLAHTCEITITGVPDCGYRIASLQVNGVDFTSGEKHILTENATVTATFTDETYTVTLNTNGGTINSGNVTSYTHGVGATLPTDITQSGKSFEGWYDNSGFTGSPVTTITTTDCGNKVYWAKWEDCPLVNSGVTLYKFEVNSSVPSGNICSAKNVPVDITTSTQLSTLVGGTLQGMVTSTSFNNLAFNSGRVTYANGGNGVLIITLDCPLEDGDLIRFNNYSSGSSKYNYLRHTSNSTADDQIKLDASKTTTEIQQKDVPAAFVGKSVLYIVSGSNTTGISYFEIIRSCPVTLDAGTNGGTVGGSSTQVVRGAIGDNVALPRASKDGYRFLGWFAAPSGGSPVGASYTITGVTTLYAQFEDCPNDGSMYKFEVASGLADGSVTANNVEFSFTTDNDLSTLMGGTLSTGGSKASYVKISGGNSISLEDNGAYLKVDLDCELKEGDAIKSTVDDNPIYVCKESSKHNTVILPIGVLQVTPIAASLAGEKTLYLWRGSGSKATISYFEIIRPKLTTITLSAPEAYNAYTPSVVATYEQPMPAIATLPVRAGYTFAGYYDGVGGTGTQYYTASGESARNWDKDVTSCTLYAKWLTPCETPPTLTSIVPVVTIWDQHPVDISLVNVSFPFDTTGIKYTLQSATPAISGCTFSYFNDYIHIMGTPTLMNAATETVDVTFTITNDCSPATTATITQTIQIYPKNQKARIAFIVRGTKGGSFNACTTSDMTSCNTVVTYLRKYYTVDYVNGYASKDPTALATYYDDYDLLVVTDFLETSEGYTNAIGTLIDKKPILSFEAYVADLSNWHIDSYPKDPSPKVQDMKVLCSGHAIFKDAKYDELDPTEVDVVNDADTTVHVLDALSTAGEAKGLQGFTINEAPDFLFLATIKDANNKRDLVVCCERQAVFPARLMIYGINFHEMPNLSQAGQIIIRQMIDYLLMTDEKNIADCSLIFDDHHNTHVWSDPANWAPGYNIVPTPYHPTRIIKPCMVDIDNAHASSVKINVGEDESHNPLTGKITVQPNGGLTVAGAINRVKDTRYASLLETEETDIQIKADASNNGALVYGNKETNVNATIEYYSRGEGATGTNPVWQYMGIPVQAGQSAIDMYYAAWMCRWSAPGSMGGLWQWVRNEDILVPFEGYCITQEATKTYKLTGKLNPPVTTIIQLDKCDGDGFAFAANSWTAPIKIQEMKDEDFVNANKSIYIYHTGSYAEWYANKENIINSDVSAATPVPGQYVVIPIHSSPYLGADSVIPAMQGFFVQTTASGAQLKLVYNRVVYDAKNFKTSTQPMRAPRRTAGAEAGAPQVMVLNVIGNTYGDRVHILARADFSEEYEDGWDGRKIEGDAAAPKLAVVKDAGEMAVAAVQTADERYLSFRAGQDEDYTFTFEYEGETLYLYDRVTQQATEIRTGNTYSFSADNQAAACRFLITANPPHETTTAIENADATRRAEKIIHEGRLLILYGDAVFDALGERVERKEGAK